MLGILHSEKDLEKLLREPDQRDFTTLVER